MRSLGNAGAMANARAVLEAARREDWVVEGLALRLERSGASSPDGVAAVAGASVAAVA